MSPMNLHFIKNKEPIPAAKYNADTFGIHIIAYYIYLQYAITTVITLPATAS